MNQKPTYGPPRPNLGAMAHELFECAWRYARICSPPEASHEALVCFADQLLSAARMRVLTVEPTRTDADTAASEGTADAALAS